MSRLGFGWQVSNLPAQLGFDVEVPDFTDCDFAAREPDADWYAVIHDGGPVRGFDRMMPAFGQALTGEQILGLQDLVRQVPVADHVFVYARDLARATRPTEPDAAKFVSSYIAWGAGPRAGQYLVIGAKARAVLEGRLHVTTDDIKAVAHPVLRHRLVTTFLADSENITSDDLVDMLLQKVPVELAERAASRVP